MLNFLLGLLIGGFLGMAFMAIFFYAKKEDEPCRELYEYIGFVHNKSDQPHSIDEKIADLDKVKFEQKKSNPMS